MGDIEKIRQPAASGKLADPLKQVARTEDRQHQRRHEKDHPAPQDAVELSEEGSESPTLIVVEGEQQPDEGGLDIAV